MCVRVSGWVPVCVCVFSTFGTVSSQAESVCAYLVQCTHHQEPQQGCDSRHYRLATPAWLIAGPGTAKAASYPQTHWHTHTGQTFSKHTPFGAIEELLNQITTQCVFHFACYQHLTNLSYISNNKCYLIITVIIAESTLKYASRGEV